MPGPLVSTSAETDLAHSPRPESNATDGAWELTTGVREPATGADTGGRGLVSVLGGELASEANELAQQPRDLAHEARADDRRRTRQPRDLARRRTPADATGRDGTRPDYRSIRTCRPLSSSESACTSASTMTFTRSVPYVVADHPSSRAALDGSPMSASTSDGRS